MKTNDTCRYRHFERKPAPSVSRWASRLTFVSPPAAWSPGAANQFPLPATAARIGQQLRVVGAQSDAPPAPLNQGPARTRLNYHCQSMDTAQTAGAVAWFASVGVLINQPGWQATAPRPMSPALCPIYDRPSTAE